MLADLSGSDRFFLPTKLLPPLPSSAPLFSQLPFPRLPLSAQAPIEQPEPQPAALDKTFQQ